MSLALNIELTNKVYILSLLNLSMVYAKLILDLDKSSKLKIKALNIGQVSEVDYSNDFELVQRTGILIIEIEEEPMAFISTHTLFEDCGFVMGTGLYASVSGTRTSRGYLFAGCVAVALATISNSMIEDESLGWVNEEFSKPNDFLKQLQTLNADDIYPSI